MSIGPLLADTGPLVALINRNDPHHQRCVAAVREWPAAPLLTTWPCWTEAMYLLFRAGGYPAQATLWRWRAVKSGCMNWRRRKSTAWRC